MIRKASDTAGMAAARDGEGSQVHVGAERKASRGQSSKKTVKRSGIRWQIGMLEPDHFYQDLRGASPLLAKKFGGATPIAAIDETFTDQRQVHQGAEGGRPSRRRFLGAEVNEGRVGGVALKQLGAPIPGVFEQPRHVVQQVDLGVALQQRQPDGGRPADVVNFRIPASRDEVAPCTCSR